MLLLRQNIMVAGGPAGKRKRVVNWYAASVLDIYDNEVLISMPRLRGRAMRVRENNSIEVSFVDGGIRYRFSSAVRQKFGREALAIELPRLIEKTDLRQYPRAEVKLDVWYSEAGAGPGRPERKKGCLVNISGNGMRIAADQIYNPGTGITAGFGLPSGNGNITVEMECQVVRVIVNDRADPVEYQLGLRFTKIKEDSRRAIIGYVNEQLGRACK